MEQLHHHLQLRGGVQAGPDHLRDRVKRIELPRPTPIPYREALQAGGGDEPFPAGFQGEGEGNGENIQSHS